MVGKVKVLLIVSGNINDNINGVGDDVIDDTVIPLKICLKTLARRQIRGDYRYIYSLRSSCILMTV